MKTRGHRQNVLRILRLHGWLHNTVGFRRCLFFDVGFVVSSFTDENVKEEMEQQQTTGDTQGCR